MTKSQLIEAIAGRAPNVPRRTVEAIVNAVWDSMVDALRAGQRIEIRGFGSFAVKTRRPREGRNPRTGQKVSVPQRRTLSFTVGKELRDRLNPLGVAPPRECAEAAAPTPAPPAPAPGGGPATDAISGPAMAAAPSRW